MSCIFRSVSQAAALPDIVECEHCECSKQHYPIYVVVQVFVAFVLMIHPSWIIFYSSTELLSILRLSLVPTCISCHYFPSSLFLHCDGPLFFYFVFSHLCVICTIHHFLWTPVLLVPICVHSFTQFTHFSLLHFIPLCYCHTFVVYCNFWVSPCLSILSHLNLTIDLFLEFLVCNIHFPWILPPSQLCE